MNYEQQLAVRHAAIDKLAEHGIWLARTSTLSIIAAQIEQLTGKKRRQSVLASDYVGAWVEVRVPVNPAYQPAFREMKRPHEDMLSSRHPRIAGIIAGQPPMMTPKGIGNLKQPGGFMPQVWGV